MINLITTENFRHLTRSFLLLLFFCLLLLFLPGKAQADICGCDCYPCYPCSWDFTQCCSDFCAWFACPGECPSDGYPGCTHSTCYNCTGCAEGCFTGETGIQLKTEDSKLETKEIKDLKPGDVVESFDPETGEVKEGTVSDVTKTTREGYYILETESGEKVRVTGEHPFLAIKAKNDQSSNSPAERDPATRDKSQTITKFQNSISKLGEIFSHTLTYRLMTSFQNKLNQIFN